MVNIIYGLRDPRNDVYQYIGKSSVGSKRAIQHLTKSHSDSVNSWVGMLANDWLYPIVDIIEEVEEIENLIEREKFWINYYHNINPNLLNIKSIEKPLKNVRTEEDEADFNVYASELICDDEQEWNNKIEKLQKELIRRKEEVKL
jgi:hypothetical protein